MEPEWECDLVLLVIQRPMTSVSVDSCDDGTQHQVALMTNSGVSRKYTE